MTPLDSDGAKIVAHDKISAVLTSGIDKRMPGEVSEFASLIKFCVSVARYPTFQDGQCVIPHCQLAGKSKLLR